MAILTIRNINDDVKTQLRVSAALKGVSMEEEARQVLTRAMENAANNANATDLASRIRMRLRGAKISGIELAIPAREAAREPLEFGTASNAKKTARTTRRKA
jgi:antitoxin FitA